jgi:isopenicillin-N epimerase
MTLVPLPSGLFAGSTRGAYTSDHAAAVQDYLHHEHRIEAPAKCIDGRLYLRISAAVHNCLEDYEHLGESILSLQRNPLDM